jgi:hypothetical protein
MTENNDGGDTRRDDTKGDYTEGDNTKGKTRRHLQSQENPTTIEAVSSPSPTLVAQRF